MSQNSFEITNPNIIDVIKKFYTQEISGDFYENFPYLDLENKQDICSFLAGDRKTYKGKLSATMKHPKILLIQNYLKQNVTKGKKAINFNKPEVCFFTYLLQNIIYNNESIYNFFIININNINN